MSQLSNSTNGQKKIIINNETKKNEEILYLYSNPINNNQNNINGNSQTSVCEFILGQKLGEGTFGTVRLGINRQTGEKVAIKILEKIKMTNYDDKNRLEREIKILNKIHHPNIVKLFCIIETDRQIFIVMEYIKGNELFQYILVKKKLEEEEACYYFLQIINCIDYLNKLKISHRDLKAENIIIEQRSKEIKLIDFGLSNIYENGQLLSTACGSPVYAAPEMLEGKLYKGLSVDIWSAGIVLFYMLCGHFPFDDVSNDKLYKKIIKGKFEIPKFLSKNAKDLITKILVVNPKKRINLRDIKKHPWIVNFFENNKNFEKIFKNIGLNTEKYIIPIDEDIIDEINNKYNVDKVELRKNILYNIVNDKSTLYYLMLNKKSKDDIKSVADMKSDLFEKYIQDKNNLLSIYNNDINLVVNKRKNGTRELNEINKNSENENNNKTVIKESQSLTNISDNNNKSAQRKNNSININKNKNRCISAQKIDNKKKIKINKNTYSNKNSNEYSSNYLTINKDTIGKKNPIINIKQKLLNKNDKNNSIAKTINVNYKKENNRLTSKKDNNVLAKSENINKNKLIKKHHNKSVDSEEQKNRNKFMINNYDKNTYTITPNLQISNLIKADEKTNRTNNENQENNGVSEFNINEKGKEKEKGEEKEEEKEKGEEKEEEKEKGEEKVEEKEKEKGEENIEKTPKKEEKKENENKSRNIEDKDNINFNYYTLNANNSTGKKDKNNSNNNFSNMKMKNNRLVLFKDMKGKNIKNKNSSLNNKNEIKENNKIKSEKDYHNHLNNDNDIKYKKIENKINIKNERNKDNIKSTNNKTFTHNKINKIKNNQFHHQKNTSLTGKVSISMNLIDENESSNSNKKTKLIKKPKNKSVIIESDNKNIIKYENLNNYMTYNSKNIKKNNNKTKLVKNIKVNKISNSVKSTVINENNHFINNNDIYKPIDINCIFVQNEKNIKNDLLKLSENKNFKIKNIRNENYSITFKNIDLSIELIIEKFDDLLSLLKFKKIKGKNSDYSNQLNIIINKLQIHTNI